MLTRFIVSSYKHLVEIILWAVLILAFAIGQDVLDSAWGGLATLLVTFGLMVIFVGNNLMLSDMRTSLKNMERHPNNPTRRPLSKQ